MKYLEESAMEYIYKKFRFLQLKMGVEEQGKTILSLHGNAIEFSEYKKYSYGDNIRYVDWKVFARTEKLYIKKFSREIAHRIYIALDISKSMDFPKNSMKTHKLEYSKYLTMLIAWLFSSLQSNINLFFFDNGIKLIMRDAPLQTIDEVLQKVESEGDSNLYASLLQILHQLLNYSILILITDFLDPHDSLTSFDTLIPTMKKKHIQVWLLHVLTEEELAPTRLISPGKMLLEEEFNRTLFVSSSSVYKTYENKLKSLLTRLHKIAKSHGFIYYLFNTNKKYFVELGNLLEGLY